MLPSHDHTLSFFALSLIVPIVSVLLLHFCKDSRGTRSGMRMDDFRLA